MKVLIIGGNGYIGSALYFKLKSLNIPVHSIDLCLFGNNIGISSQENYNNADIESYSHIVLLAAHSSVSMANNNRINAWENNVTYFYNLCNRITKDQVLIYASSASVYGQQQKLNVESDINLNAVNFYDLTKITNDIIANKFISDGYNIIGLRFGTLNGFSYNIRSDLMINSMYYNAKILHKPINVKNRHLHRPLLGVNDCTNAIIRILETKPHPGQFNLNSFNTTVDNIGNTVSEILGADINYLPNDPDYSVYDFTMSSEKFTNYYQFEFCDNIESITTSLLETTSEVYSVRDTDHGFLTK